MFDGLVLKLGQNLGTKIESQQHKNRSSRKCFMYIKSSNAHLSCHAFPHCYLLDFPGFLLAPLILDFLCLAPPSFPPAFLPFLGFHSPGSAFSRKPGTTPCRTATTGKDRCKCKPKPPPMQKKLRNASPAP